MKPSNIIVLQNGGVKVADFGIARIDASEFTIVGDLLGTPAYMAPEQLSGAPVDFRTDLFAAGVILFEMLTGVKPFRGKSITEIMSFMETRGPEDVRALNPAVPDALKQVITKSVAFDPSQRYADAATFSQAICDAVPAATGEPRISAASAPAAPVSETKTMPLPSLQPSAGEASLHPDLLREIERDLATFIGPMASIAVKRAVRQASDVVGLYEVLSKQIAGPQDRSKFLTRGRQRAASGLARPLPSPAPARSTGPRPERPLVSPSPASIVAIEADLTRYVGPIAKILVKRELQKFETLTKFCLLLAAHIPNERDRRAFLNAHGAD